MNNLYKFRKYNKKQGKKKIKHPKLIVDEYKDEFGFMGLTSNKRKGRGHNNLELEDNPQLINEKRLKKKSYLRRKIEYDNKSNFGKIMNNYSLSKRDKEKLMIYVKNKKKKR